MKIFTLLLAIGWVSLSFCQTYTFSAFPGGYNDLIVPTSLNNGQTWDDPEYTVPIGFTFEYFGEPITSIQLSSDGLGGLLKKGNCFSDPDESYMFAYGADIIDRGDDGPVSLSNISHQTLGTAGSRICKVEWNNVGFYDGTNDMNGNRIDYMNFQLWMYETTNVIEIRFGPKSITEPLVDFEGETGSFVAFVHKVDCGSGDILGHQLILGGNPSIPTFYDNVINLNDTIVTLGGVIPPSTVYRFLPALTTSQDELSSFSPFSVVPNPAQDKLRLVRNENEGAEVRRASIIDLNGKVLLSDLEFNQEISISTLHTGMYFIQVEMMSGEAYSEKFTKL